MGGGVGMGEVTLKFEWGGRGLGVKLEEEERMQVYI
jgi:hypothetical protein